MMRLRKSGTLRAGRSSRVRKLRALAERTAGNCRAVPYGLAVLAAIGMATILLLPLHAGVAEAASPSVSCATFSSTLAISITGQTTQSQALFIGAVPATGGYDYALTLGGLAPVVNADCAGLSLSTYTSVFVSSSGTASQYVAIDNTSGAFASVIAGCAVTFTVELSAPAIGTDVLQVLTDDTAPSQGDDTVGVASAVSAGNTSEALILSEGACGSNADVVVPSFSAQPTILISGQPTTSNVLNLSADTTTSLTVNAGADSAASPGTVSGMPGGVGVQFYGITTIDGGAKGTDFQPGTATEVTFAGEGSPASNVLDLSNEVSSANLTVSVNQDSAASPGTVTGSVGGVSIDDQFYDIATVNGSPAGTTFQPGSASGLTFVGQSSATNNVLDLFSEPPGVNFQLEGTAGSACHGGEETAVTTSQLSDTACNIITFLGSPAGNNTFISDGLGGHNFEALGTGNLLDLSNLSSSLHGVTVDAAGGCSLNSDCVTGLNSNTVLTGASSTDHFSEIQAFNGAPGGTTFQSSGAGGLTFGGANGVSNTLDLSSAPTDVQIGSCDGSVLVGSNSETFAGISQFIGSTQGGTTFVADPSSLVSGAMCGSSSAITFPLSFQGKGSGNTLQLSTLALGGSASATFNVAPAGRGPGTLTLGSAQFDSFAGIQSFAGPAAGNTTFITGSTGGLSFNGQGSNNTLSFQDVASGAAGVQIDLDQQTANPGTGSDTFADIQTIEGSPNNDTFFAGPGDFTIIGGGGSDTLSDVAAPFPVTVSLNNGQPTVTGGFPGNTLVSGITTFVGSNSGNNSFLADAYGGYSFEAPSSSTNNFLSFANVEPSTIPGVSIAITTATGNGTTSGLSSTVTGSTTDSFQNIQSFTGSPGSDSFTVGAGSFALNGGGGADSLSVAPAPSGVTFDLVHGTVTGGNVNDRFDGSFVDFTGSSAGSTTFLPTDSGGYEFVGQGSGNTLDVTAAGAIVVTGGNSLAQPGTVSGLIPGLGGSTVDQFAGIQNFSGSAKVCANATVNCTVTLSSTDTSNPSSPANTSTVGDTVTFTASVTPSSATGTVQFKIDGTAVGGPVPVAPGFSPSLGPVVQAQYSTAALAAGNHSVEADYSGDSQNPAASATLAGGQTVNKAGSSIAVSSSSANNTSSYGQNVTFTAAVSGPGTTPTGTVQFYIDGGAAGPLVSLDGNGHAQYQTLSLSVGPHDVEAVYGGDSNYLGSNGTLSGGQTVTPAAPTIASISPTSGPGGGGTTVTIIGNNLAGATSVKFGANEAAFTEDTSNSISATSPAGTPGTTVDVVVTTAGGTSAVTSAGTFMYSSQGATTTSVSCDPESILIGQAAQCQAIVVSTEAIDGAPDGSVSFAISGFPSPTAECTLSQLPFLTSQCAVNFTASASGSISVTATYEGSALFAGSSATTSVSVTRAAGVALTSSDLSNPSEPANTSAFGDNVVFNGAVTPAGATGSLQFYVDGAAAGPAVSLDSSGNAQYQTVSLSVGLHSVEADYSGDANYHSSVGTLSGGQMVTAGSPTIISVSPNSGPAAGGTAVTINGSNLAGATSVKFGANEAAFSEDSSNSISATSPAGTPGSMVDVVVTTAGGTSAATSADKFSYQTPTITSPSGTTFSVGVAGSFKVTSSGLPAGASIAETGTLPGGISFVDNGNGTATLVGTPAAGTGGNYPFTIIAGNGVAPSATQTFTLTVDQAPAITSASSTTFTVGKAGSFSVTTTGFPMASISAGSPPLPSGVSFVDNGNGTATLFGTPAPATAGSYPFTITAANGVAPSPTQSFTLSVVSYVASPAVTSISPSSGPAAGHTTVVVNGSGFSTANGGTAINFGANASQNVSCVSVSQCYADSPAGSGIVDVTATVGGQASAANSADLFTYSATPAVTGISPNSGPTSGSTAVTITGAYLSAPGETTTVSFGGTAATGVSCASATTCFATSPAGTGTVDVIVSVGAASTAPGSADKFSYQVTPAAVTSVTPNSGSVNGGTTVTISGTGFVAGATTVEFGANAATGVSCMTTTCKATSPAGSGMVDVTVTVGGQKSAKTAADQFSYTGTAAQVFSFATSPLQAYAGLTAEPVLQVALPHGVQLGAFTVDITYDPSVLQALGCTAAQPSVTVACNSNYGAATMRLTGAQTDNDGNAPTQLLANLSFQAIGPVGSSSTLSLSVDSLTNYSGAALGSNTQNGQVSLILAGDINGDGVVNALDALCVLRMVTGLPATTACPAVPLSRGIVVAGETTPTAVDALCILRGVVGLPATAICPALSASVASSPPPTVGEGQGERSTPGAAVLAQGAGNVTVAAHEQAGGTGRTRTVEIQASVGTGALGAWSIDVSYDAATTKVTGCDAPEGSVCNTNYQPGMVRISGADASGLHGDQTLATLTVEGTGTMKLTAQTATNTDGIPLKATIAGSGSGSEPSQRP